MGRQGDYLTDKQKDRIVYLLAHTDLPLADVAARIHRSKSAVVAFNRKMGIRIYDGHRSRWKVAELWARTG